MKLDGYEVLSEVARGSQGIVYEARDLRSGRRVAVKVLLEVGQNLLERFEREAEVLARLRHPNVVSIHGAGRAQGRPYIVMELVEGKSLSQSLAERGAFEPKEAARIVRDLARGAGQAHLRGLVHRDIKPANAILRPDETVILTDFGLARDQESASDLSKTGIFMGTPGFASPEQASGEGKRVGPASDVYGLGALLFALLCERAPAEGDLLEVVIATLTTPPPNPREFNPDVDPGLAAICLRCLAKRPEERYPDGSALADELDRYLKGEAISAGRSSGAPLALAGLGLLCVLGLGGAALYAMTPADPVPGLASAAPSLAASVEPQPEGPQETLERAPTPDPALERTLRLVRAKTRPDELDSAIEILSEALARAEGASNRLPSERFLADLHTRRADQVMRRGPAEVSADLRRAAALDPTPTRRAALAEAVMREGLHLSGEPSSAGRWPSARKLLREAVELAPGDPRMPSTLGEQGRNHKDWESMALGFGEAYRIDAKSVSAMTGLTHALGEQGRAREGLVVAREFLERQPKSQRANAVLGYLLCEQGRWFEARAAYEAVSSRSMAYEGARLGLAWIALEEERPTYALTLLEGVRQTKFEAIAIRGFAHLNAHEYGRAEGALQGVMDMRTPDVRLVWAYLRALYGGRKRKEAKEAIEALIQGGALPPTQILFFQAHHFARVGEHSEAKKTFQRLHGELAGGARDSWAAIEMGTFFSQWGRYHLPALTVELSKLAAAASSDDEDAHAWILEAKGLKLLHRYAQARELLARAARVHPTRVDLHHTLAGVESGARRFEASVAAAARSLELEPTSVYSAVIGAESCLGARRYADAKPFLAVCVPALESSPIPRSLQAVMNVELGDPDAAEEDVAWATKLAPDRPQTQLARGALLVARGRFDEAQALVAPVSKRPDRGWPTGYARELLERIRARRK